MINRFSSDLIVISPEKIEEQVMKMNDNWKTTPISLLILQVLDKRDGLILDNELMSLVEQELGYRPSNQEFSRELMNLELNGQIHVSNIKKTQRRVAFLREEQEYLAIGED